MGGWLEPGWERAHVQADALANMLAAKGFVTVVYKTGGHQQHPCVKVTSGRWRLVQITEFIYAAPEDGAWWFWWSWESLERIVPVGEVSVAVDKIARAHVRR